MSINQIRAEDLRQAIDAGHTAYCNWCYEFVEVYSQMCSNCGSDDVEHELAYHLDVAEAREASERPEV